MGTPREPQRAAGETRRSALVAALQRIVSEDPPLIGPLAGGATAITASTGLQQTLGAFIGTAAVFIGTAAAVDALLWLLYVSLAVTAAIVLLLAARMIVLRRATELALRRARGASLLQTGLAAGRGAAIGCVPAAVIAGAVAVLLVPGPAPPGGWWPGTRCARDRGLRARRPGRLAAAAAPLR